MPNEIANEPGSSGHIEQRQLAHEHQQKAGVTAEDQLNVHLSDWEATLFALPEIRLERVLRLRQALVSGTYSISDAQLGEAMMRGSRER